MQSETKNTLKWLLPSGPLVNQTKKPQLMLARNMPRSKWSSSRLREIRKGTYRGGKFKAKVY